MTDQTTADPAAENAAILDNYWVRAMEGLVQQGIPWEEAAAAMLRIAVLQVEAALGIDVAERSCAGARDYFAQKRGSVVQQDKSTSTARH